MNDEKDDTKISHEINLHNGNLSHGHATTILKINHELMMCANLCLQIPACPPKLAVSRDKDLEACLPCQLVVGAIWANQSGTLREHYCPCMNGGPLNGAHSEEVLCVAILEIVKKMFSVLCTYCMNRLV